MWIIGSHTIEEFSPDELRRQGMQRRRYASVQSEVDLLNFPVKPKEKKKKTYLETI